MMSHCPGCSSRCCPRETLSKIRRPSEARSLDPRCQYPRDLRCTTSTGHLEGSEVFFLNWGDKTLGLQQSWQLGAWSCQRVNFTDDTFQKTSKCDPSADFQRGQRTGEKTLLPVVVVESTSARSVWSHRPCYSTHRSSDSSPPHRPHLDLWTTPIAGYVAHEDLPSEAVLYGRVWVMTLQLIRPSKRLHFRLLYTRQTTYHSSASTLLMLVATIWGSNKNGSSHFAWLKSQRNQVGCSHKIYVCVHKCF